MSSAGNAARSARSNARGAAKSRPVKIAARVGIAAYGVTHLLIAWLALQLIQGSGAEADQGGAFQTLAAQPYGQVLLWVLVVGFVAVALWRLELTIWGFSYIDDTTKKIRKKVTAGVKVVLFSVLAVTAARTASGGGQGGGGQGGDSQQEATAGVLGIPGGVFLVAAAGLVVIGVGVKKVVDGVRQSFRDEMDLPSDARARTVAIRTGQVGFIAKGVSIGLIGGLVVAAAFYQDPDQSGGLDVALQALLAQPFGPYLLGAMALGLVAYAVFCAFDARYHRV